MTRSDLRPTGRAVAEEFAERYRRGERPALTEYTDRYPELAEQIRDLFPALVVMEQFGSGADRPGRRRPTRQEVRDDPASSWATTGSSARSAGAAWASSTRRCRIARPARRAEGAAVHAVARPEPAGAVPPRGPGGGPAAPHQHRAGLRRRRGRGRPLLRHAVHPGPEPRRVLDELRPAPRRVGTDAGRRRTPRPGRWPRDQRRRGAGGPAGSRPRSRGRDGPARRTPSARPAGVGRGSRPAVGGRRRASPERHSDLAGQSGSLLPQRGPGRRAGGRGPGLRPPPGDPPPRHQAVEPAARHRRARSGSPTSAWPRPRAPTS